MAESGTINVDVKEKIGKAAAAFISPGETVMLDAGSTTAQVVRHLQSSNLTLVTNSFDAVISAMSKPEIDLLMVGGLVRVHGGATVGPTAEDQIRLFKADTAVLGMNGVSPDDGLTTPNLLVAQIKRQMIAQSNRLILVADHTKLGVSALCRVAPMETVEVLVTDEDADPEILDAIRALGVEVVVAK